MFTSLPIVKDHFNVEKAFLDSWKALNVEYIDRYLLHWPRALVDQTVGSLLEYAATI